MGLGAFRRRRLGKPELGALREAPLGLGDGAQPARQADLAEAGERRANRHAAGSRRDRERDAEVGARLVDPNAAGDVDEDVGLAERDARVAAEHGDDHREALRVDARADAPRHGEIGRRDERLDLEQQRARPLERARRRRSPAAPSSPRPKSSDGIRDRRRGRRTSSRRRRARSSSRSGSSPRAGRGASGSGRPRTGGRSRRGARGRAGRRPRRPSSRGRRGRWRCRAPWRRAGAGPAASRTCATEPGAEPSSGA